MKRLILVSCLVMSSLAGCDSDDDADPSGDAGGRQDAGDTPDAGGMTTTPEACFGELAPVGDAWFVELQRFESEDGAVRVWRSRQPGDRSAVGETFPYDLVKVWIETEDEPGTCISSASALSYTFGHHNWAEQWTATTEVAKYIGREMFSNAPANPQEWGWTDTLEAQDEAGATLFMVNLVEDGCETSPYDLNPCLMRMRTDMPPEGWGEE